MGSSTKTVVALLALINFLHLEVAEVAAQGDQCYTPEDQNGVCISIYDCPPLLYKLQSEREAAASYLRRSQCGYEARVPKVCCPAETRGPDRNEGGNNNNNNNNNWSSQGRRYEPLLPPYCGFSNATHTRVVGGVPAKLGAWPWIAVLGYKSTKDPSRLRWLCGGTLISPRHVVTAGHCVHGRDDLMKVRLGDLDLTSDYDGAYPIDVVIVKKTIHPQYSSVNYINDIAMLTLEYDVQFTDQIRPICLPLQDPIRHKVLDRTYPFIAGWGSVEYRGPSSNILMELQIPVVDTASCKKAFSRFSNAIIDDRTLCAGYARGGKDACQGDSGGPLMMPQRTTYYLVGVVSYGYMCAEPGYPGIYTRVTSFLDFIQSNMVA